MRTRLMIPLALAALIGCADNVPTGPTPRAMSQRPLLGAFPGSNGKLAYFGSSGGIETMNPDGTGVQPFVAGGLGPAWNADGTKMAFYAPLTEGGPTEIFVINADGTDKTQLTFNSTQPGLAFPAWSPDGSKIAFQNDFDRKIYVMNSDGSNVIGLTSSGADALPAWSPDGSKIAFTSWRDNGITEIYVMNSNGSNQTRLTTNLTPDFDPSWSPNGARILFMHEGGNPGDNADVFTMDPDGTDVINLTNSAGRADVSAVWSPDGSKIAFISSDETNAEIYVMNADGSNQAPITTTSFREFHLDWQPQPTAPVCVFGQTYTRTQGPPARITERFAATPGSYSVDLDDLATSGADAVVTLNGVVIMEGRGTTGEVGPRHKTVTVTLLAQNVLEIQLRGKRDSKLKVTICASAGAQCYPNLPAPQLTLESTTDDGTNVRFEFDVPNYAQFPADLFVQAPDLAACGSNTSASRTWVDIYDGNGNFVNGFCSFSSPSDLNLIWSQTSVAQRPAEVYITLTDRRCNIVYTSNRVNLGGGL